MNRKTDQFETLNAMRGVAALAVVLYHSVGLTGIQVAPSGYLAVDVFFVLSGFVISHAYDNRLSSGLGARRFAWLRIARFWPLLVLGACIGALRSAIGIAMHSEGALSIPELGIAFVSGLFLVPAPIDEAGHLFFLNTPMWTLLFELIVNILYAVALRRLSTFWLAVLAVLGGTCMVAFIALVGFNNLGATIPTVVGGIGRTLFGFCLGVLIYRFRLPFPKVPATAILAIAALLLLVPVSDGFRVVYDIIFAVIAAPLLVLAGSSTEPARFWRPLAVYLGLVSFVIYAIHAPILGIGEALVKRLGVSSWVLGLGIVAVLLIAAPLIDRFYDRPMRRLLLSLPSGRQAVA